MFISTIAVGPWRDVESCVTGGFDEAYGCGVANERFWLRAFDVEVSLDMLARDALLVS